MKQLPVRLIPPQIVSIIEQHAYRYGCTYLDVLGPGRQARFVRARRASAIQMRDRGLPLELIGAYLRRHHTTIIHLVNTPVIEERTY